MSNSTISSFTFASQQVVLYMGLFEFISGLIGNPLTLIVFVSLRTFRESSCVFYLIIMSIVDTFLLFTGLFTYIMINGIGINLLNMSLFYCKFRPFYVQLCILISFSCMCFAIIDQFLATCSRPRWQQLCNIKVARCLLAGITIIWIIHGIPFLLYYDHIPSSSTGISICVITSIVFHRYYTLFYALILASVLPVTITIIFAILAYRNVKQIAYRTVPLVRRELDKQLTVMVLVQVFYNAIAIMPFGIIGIFSTIYGTSTDPITAAQLSFITNITTTIYYFQYVVRINCFKYYNENYRFFCFFSRVRFISI